MKKRSILAIEICLMLSAVKVAASDSETSLYQQKIFTGEQCGAAFAIPEEYRNVKGTIDYMDFGDDYELSRGIVQMVAQYYPMSEDRLIRLYEEEAEAENEGDIEKAMEIIDQMYHHDLFHVYGINDGRGVNELIEYLLPETDTETADQDEFVLTDEEIAAQTEAVLSQHYSELGTCEDFTYILVTEDPESLKNEGLFPGYNDEYFEEYIALLENTERLVKDNISLIGGVELDTPPADLPGEGKTIRFDAEDLDGNPVRSEDLFSGHTLTMINLWATWCTPCKAELPNLEKLNKELSEKNCQIIGIVTDAYDDEKLARAKEILEDKGVTYMNLAAFEGLSDLLPQNSWPTSYFLDENGTLVGEPIAGAYLDQYEKMFDK